MPTSQPVPSSPERQPRAWRARRSRGDLLAEVRSNRLRRLEEVDHAALRRQVVQRIVGQLLRSQAAPDTDVAVQLEVEVQGLVHRLLRIEYQHARLQRTRGIDVGDQR